MGDLYDVEKDASGSWQSRVCHLCGILYGAPYSKMYIGLYSVL